MELLKYYLKKFDNWKQTEDGQELITKNEDKKRQFPEIFSEDNLKNANDEKFKSDLKKAFNKLISPIRGNPAREILNNNKKLRVLRDALYDLLYEQAPIGERYQKFWKEVKEEEKIKGLGPARISEILAFVFPEKYPICNRLILGSLDKLGLLEYLIKKHEFKKSKLVKHGYGKTKYDCQIDGREFESIVKYMTELKAKIEGLYGKKLDFIDLNLFLYYVSKHWPPDYDYVSEHSLPNYDCSEIGNEYEEKIRNIIKDNYQVIFYGPPGTGKTWLAKRYVACEAGQNNGVEAGFVTFHQSYSYEEFVEGVWPETSGGGELRYRVRDGIFKEAAIRATFDLLKSFCKNNCSGTGEKSCGNSGIGKLCNDENKNIECGHGEDYDKCKHAVVGFLKMTRNPKVYRQIREFWQKSKNQEEVRRHYLIIDEINRGDISRIFGELITLLEPDKRIGRENQIVTILPYSREPFAIPPNLYIIGTMNTADRSIALIDVALRRRFAFMEIPPDPKTIKDSDLSGLLEKLNKAIGKAYDRDHRIGHSYFLKVLHCNSGEDTEPCTSEEIKVDYEALGRVWLYEIIPLLQEYFYNKWDKLWEVLESSLGQEIAKLFIEGDVKDSRRMRLRDPFEIKSEIRGLINKSEKSGEKCGGKVEEECLGMMLLGKNKD